MKKIFFAAASVIMMTMGFVACNNTNTPENPDNPQNPGQTDTTKQEEVSNIFYDEPYLTFGTDTNTVKREMAKVGTYLGTNTVVDTTIIYFSPVNKQKQALQYVSYFDANQLKQQQIVIPALANAAKTGLDENQQKQLMTVLGSEYTYIQANESNTTLYFKHKTKENVYVGMSIQVIQNAYYYILFYYEVKQSAGAVMRMPILK